MLRKRLIGCLVIKNGIVVQSINFKKYLPIGKPEIAVEFLNAWGIDEIIIVDLNSSYSRSLMSREKIQAITRHCFVPLTIGGGIHTIDQMTHLIHAGSDKIVINQAAIANPELITAGSVKFGSQCIVVSIDVKKNENDKYEVFTQSGHHPTGLSPVDWARESQERGAGEIFLNSVDRDGSKQGYDLELAEMVANSISIPVIICGGVGHPRHFLEAATISNISAVAAANFFHYTEHSVVLAKAYLKSQGLETRIDTYVNYLENDFCEDDGRLLKKSDQQLDELIFEYFPKEVI